MRVIIQKNCGVTDGNGEPMHAVYIESVAGVRRNRRYFRRLEDANQYAEHLRERSGRMENDY